MANTLKELTDSASKFVVGSLDNVKDLIDRSTDEVAKADVLGAGRRIADQFLDGTKETVNRMADCASQADPVAAVRHLATGTLENARETVRVASEESQRINLVETGSRVTQEGIDSIRRQVDLGFDTGREVGQALERAMPARLLTGEASKGVRPGMVTRVDIETDKGHLRTETDKGHLRTETVR